MPELETDHTRARTEIIYGAGATASTEVTKTYTLDELVEGTGFLRSAAAAFGADVCDIHHLAIELRLDEKAGDLVKRSAVNLLSELADAGFSWRDIAAMAGVSVPAVRKWRLGESLTPEHHFDIARLVALVETIPADHMVEDFAAWMEVPIVQSAPLTKIDLAIAHRYQDIADLASSQRSGEQVLDDWRPDWRERYRSQFEVFEASDGELSIRFAKNEGT